MRVNDQSEAAPAAEQPAASVGFDWKGELKGVFWLVLAVLGALSLVAKPFFIPS